MATIDTRDGVPMDGLSLNTAYEMTPIVCTQEDIPDVMKDITKRFDLKLFYDYLQSSGERFRRRRHRVIKSIEKLNQRGIRLLRSLDILCQN